MSMWSFTADDTNMNSFVGKVYNFTVNSTAEAPVKSC